MTVDAWRDRSGMLECTENENSRLLLTLISCILEVSARGQKVTKRQHVITARLLEEGRSATDSATPYPLCIFALQAAPMLCTATRHCWAKPAASECTSHAGADLVGDLPCPVLPTGC